MEESDRYFWDKAESTLAEMLESQETDSLWASRVKDEVLRSFDSEAVEDTSLDSIDCRQTLCKISFIHKDKNAYDHSLEIIQESDWMTTNSSNAYGNKEIREDGTVASHVYFTKKDNGDAFLEIRKRIVEKVSNDFSS